MSIDIICIDKSGVIKVELSNILRSLNIGFLSVKSEVEALNILSEKKEKIRAVVWVQNSADAEELGGIRVLKSKEAFKTLPVIVISRFTDKKYILKAVESGAVEFIAKPYDEDLVLKKFCRILGVSVEQAKSRVEDIAAFSFAEMFTRDIKAASRGSYPLSILLLSVIREQNEMSALSSGEELIATVNRVMKAKLRETDTAFLHGKNSLIILLPFANKMGAQTVEKKIRYIFSANSVIRQKSQGYRLVMASVTFPEDGKIRDKLLEKLENKFSENVKKSQNNDA